MNLVWVSVRAALPLSLFIPDALESVFARHSKDAQDLLNSAVVELRGRLVKARRKHSGGIITILTVILWASPGCILAQHNLLEPPFGMDSFEAVCLVDLRVFHRPRGSSCSG